MSFTAEALASHGFLVVDAFRYVISQTRSAPAVSSGTSKTACAMPSGRSASFAPIRMRIWST